MDRYDTTEVVRQDRVERIRGGDREAPLSVISPREQEVTLSHCLEINIRNRTTILVDSTGVILIPLKDFTLSKCIDITVALDVIPASRNSTECRIPLVVHTIPCCPIVIEHVIGSRVDKEITNFSVGGCRVSSTSFNRGTPEGYLTPCLGSCDVSTLSPSIGEGTRRVTGEGRRPISRNTEELPVCVITVLVNQHTFLELLCRDLQTQSLCSNRSKTALDVLREYKWEV